MTSRDLIPATLLTWRGRIAGNVVAGIAVGEKEFLSFCCDAVRSGRGELRKLSIIHLVVMFAERHGLVEVSDILVAVVSTRVIALYQIIMQLALHCKICVNI